MSFIFVKMRQNWKLHNRCYHISLSINFLDVIYTCVKLLLDIVPWIDPITSINVKLRRALEKESTCKSPEKSPREDSWYRMTTSTYQKEHVLSNKINLHNILQNWDKNVENLKTTNETENPKLQA